MQIGTLPNGVKFEVSPPLVLAVEAIRDGIVTVEQLKQIIELSYECPYEQVEREVMRIQENAPCLDTE